MIDKNKLYNDLTLLFILIEYRRNHIPVTARDFNESEEEAIKLYHNHPLFHAGIDNIVHKIVDVVLDAEQ